MKVNKEITYIGYGLTAEIMMILLNSTMLVRLVGDPETNRRRRG
ncbi:MAG: hypothetical protein R6U96_06565 [Promethearchaeia archaeon]